MWRLIKTHKSKERERGEHGPAPRRALPLGAHDLVWRSTLLKQQPRLALSLDEVACVMKTCVNKKETHENVDTSRET